MPKSYEICLRLSAEEKERLEHSARTCGLSKTAYLRRLILGKEVKALPSQEIKALRTEVHKMCIRDRGSLDRNRQVRAEFVTLGHADHYAALRLTLLDNNQGVVDKLILRFKDIWGKKKIPNNPYLRDGVAPHIWVDGDRIDWYAYHPSQEDYQQLRQIARCV